MRRIVRPAIAGVLACGAGLAVAQLIAALTRPGSAPLVTIGGTVIDATPTAVKEYAVREFGTADKPLLLSGILLGLTVIAAAIGVLTSRRRQLGLLAAAGLGLVGVAAALTRPTGRPVDALPAAVAAIVAVVILAAFTTHAVPAEVSRRRFFTNATVIAGVSVLAGGGAAVAERISRQRVNRAREQIALPAAAEPAGPMVDAAGFYTGNEVFYRVDTALNVPRIDVDSWRLQITGMVDRPITLTYDDLLRRPLVERDITLNCVSNEIGGPYIGTARWLGVALAPLLREAGIHAIADQIVARSVEGMTIGTPVQTALDGRDTMLAVAMNGQPLPPQHGFPARMLTPGLYGYAGACKWVTSLELTRFDSFDAYWVRRGWADRAPVKTASRIDRPASFARLQPGENVIAGVAWAQTRGIAEVEIQINDEPWQPAQLAPSPTLDAWVQWRLVWKANKGGYTIRVRATDRHGVTQPEQRQPPFPDGATGWHTIIVTII